VGRPLTITGLLALIFLLGLCLAALANPSPSWAGVMFGLTLAALLTGVLCCLFRRGEARVLWAGFTAFGWAALMVLFACPDRFAGVAMADIVYELTSVIHPFDMAKYQAMSDSAEKEAAWAFHRRVMDHGQAITKSVLILAFSALGVVSAWAFALQRTQPGTRVQRPAAEAAPSGPATPKGASSD